MVTFQKAKADLDEKQKKKKRLMIVSTKKRCNKFVIVIKKIKIASVYEKQWEISKEEPTGILNFRAGFD